MSAPCGFLNYVKFEVHKQQLAELDELERQVLLEHHPEIIEEAHGKQPKRLPTRNTFWEETVEWQELTGT